jgi:drug/metabolite transporter (DMT)-like permease
VLTAALVWAIGSLYSKKKQPASSPFVSGGMQMLCGGLAMVVVGLLRGEATDFHVAAITTKSWIAYAYLVTFGSIVAFTAYIWLLRHVEPALAGTYAFVNPVVAVLLGWAFAGETLNAQMLGGAALIVIAVVLVVLGGRRKAPARPLEASRVA